MRACLAKLNTSPELHSKRDRATPAFTITAHLSPTADYERVSADHVATPLARAVERANALVSRALIAFASAIDVCARAEGGPARDAPRRRLFKFGHKRQTSVA